MLPTATKPEASAPAEAFATLLTDEPSQLRYRHRPAVGEARARLLLLHGVGGNETNLLGLAAAVASDVEILSVRGPIDLGGNQHAFFRVNFSNVGPRLDPAEAESARSQLIRLIESAASADAHPLPTVIAGFSQGGIMSASVALTSPQSVAGFGILSGRILPEIAPQIAAPAALRHLRAFVSHGNADNVLPPFMADQSEALLRERGITLETRRYAAPHMVTPEMQHDFLAWLDELLRPAPVRLTLNDNTLELGNDDGQIVLTLGAAALRASYLRSQPPTPFELENAIQYVEDALMPAWKRFASTELISSQPWLDTLADFARSPRSRITREALESAFNRLAALSQGRPLSQDPLPEDPDFSARLLILRELMHHLDFRQIRAG